jgi:hypothetical protein
LTLQRCQGCLDELAVLPRYVYLESAACAQSFDLSGRPRPGQRREQVDFSGVTLQQHLGNTCGSAKITIDLERRVGVK